MPLDSSNNARQRFSVVMVPAGDSGGTADPSWSSFSGGAVDFPALPVVDPGGLAAGPILGGPTLKPLTLKRGLASGHSPTQEVLRAHIAAIASGSQPVPLDITIQDDASTSRRLTYRRAYLRRWQIDSFDSRSKEVCNEVFEFLASELEITR